MVLRLGIICLQLLHYSWYLLHLQEWLWGIVMSTSECLSVCNDISGTTCAISTKIFVRVASGRGSVLLQQGDKIPRWRGSFGGFLSHWQCIVQPSIWDPYRNGWTDWVAVWAMSGLGPTNSVFHGGDDPRRRRTVLGGNVPDKCSTPMNCELEWSIQRRAHDRGRRLIATLL